MDVAEMIFEQLSPVEQQVFNSYKACSFDLNTSLRTGTIPDDVNILDELIYRYECSTVFTLYRAVPLYTIANQLNNNIYLDPAYLSCSRDKDSVYKFCTEEKMAILVIHCHAGTNMIDLNVNPQFSEDETEFLLPLNLRFTTTKTKELCSYDEICEYFDGDRWIADGIKHLIEFRLSIVK